jgi:hypothetical protein
VNYLNGTTEILTLDQAKRVLAEQTPDTVAHLSATPALENEETTTSTETYNSSTRRSNSTSGTSYNGDQTVVHHHYHSGAGLSTILWYSAMGHMMGRSMAAAPVRTFYATPQAYQSSSNIHSVVRSSKVSRPSGSSRGYFRSSSSSSSGRSASS